jgi:hypothetical protein
MRFERSDAKFAKASGSDLVFSFEFDSKRQDLTL